jgi:hypothetical protein
MAFSLCVHALMRGWCPFRAHDVLGRDLNCSESELGLPMKRSEMIQTSKRALVCRTVPPLLVDVQPGQKTKFTLNRFRPWSAEPFATVEVFK